jgi:hypothetical protein
MSKLLEKISELREELDEPTENRYLTKVCMLLRPPESPRSERSVHRPKRIKKPKLRKFTAKINHKNYK